MAHLKILFQEQGTFTPSDKFISDAKELVDTWIRKVFKEEPTVKAYAFSSNKNSCLLQVIQSEIPELPVEFIEEGDSEIDLNKPAPNVIAGIISDTDEIMGFQIQTGTAVPAKFFSDYVSLKKLAQCVNDK
jgi:hypothetical protein